MSATELQASVQSIPMSKKEKGSRLIARAPEGFAEPQAAGKWSGRKTLFFIVVVSAALWAAIIAGVIALF